MGIIKDILFKAISKLTKAFRILTTDHDYIHRGKGFDVIGITGSIAAGASYKFSFTTPNASDPNVVSDQRYVHWRPAFIGGTDAGVSYFLYKDSTSISGGTEETIQNMNENSPRKSQMQSFKKGATATEGTAIQGYMNGTGGSGVSSSGGGGGAEFEKVLKPNTTYTVKLTNESGSTASTIIYAFFWYEEEGYKE